MNSLFNRGVKGKLYRLIYEFNKDNTIKIKTSVGITNSHTDNSKYQSTIQETNKDFGAKWDNQQIL